MKNKLFFIFIFLVILIISILIIFIFLNKNKIDYKIVDYTYETNIYIDRDYVNERKSNFLINNLLFQTSRHNNKKIIFFSKSPITIYRPTCTLNNNNSYQNNWKLLEYNVNISGVSCIHSRVYYKKFNSPLVILDSGGPIASDPIFIKSSNKKNKIIVLNKKK